MVIDNKIHTIIYTSFLAKTRHLGGEIQISTFQNTKAKWIVMQRGIFSFRQGVIPKLYIFITYKVQTFLAA